MTKPELYRDNSRVRHMLDIGGKLRRVDAPKAVALAAREDRRGDLLQLGRREDKDQMLRRLLDDLQKRVEGRGRQHVHLVDDIHALFHRRGRENRLLAQRAHIVHAVVRGGVQLDHIEDRAVRNAAAGGALSAGVAVGRFARSARTDKDIGMRQAGGADLVFQRFGDMLLADDVVKGLRPPLPIQGLIHALSSFAQGNNSL